ncbi:MAG TPA: ribose-phosphate diphosphokinase [Methanospirillum sp.]|jgi:ribose-phosphate pyrophosphokinase|uniref:ribose-phosphate diphosphokinase n=1 Tax=Methanospirillum sp. TaxID=45200 RepID=UPI001BD2755C|nr:ribose-phosphate diphosphokinase [Methanospirillum sp.]HQB98919.1 ribose-phosphate diphosphokinase [Methanospirillum sp.]
MKIVSTQRSQVLASRLGVALNIPIIDARWQKFPDGEIYVRADSPAEKVIICGSYLTSDDLVELLLLKDIYNYSDISLVIPYMGYARQDKQFNPGEPLSARAVAQVLGRDVSQVLTVNVHEKSVLKYFNTKSTDISLSIPAAKFIETLSLENPLILSPDEGAHNLAKDVASIGKWETDYLQKTRMSGDHVIIEPKSVQVQGRDVVILDDIISTGGTQATAASMLFNQGVRSLHTVGIHGVLTSGAYARLTSAGISSISCSDTIERACSTFTAAGALAKYL